MTTNFIKKKIKKEQNRTFTARDFESLRSQLLDSARTYFPDKIQDFSEPSVGGMFLDFAATVGDSLNYYLDHSFKELDPSQAVESDNIITHLRNAGVEIVGAAPATVDLTFSFNVPSEEINIAAVGTGVYQPKRSALPVILAGTSAASFSGINFYTTDDIDFSETDENGNLICEFIVASVNADGSPATFTVSRKVNAVSGTEITESINIPDTFVPFREITLAEKSITTILSITDSDSNTYYEVSSLSEDTAFLKIKNPFSDAAQIRNYMQVISIPYRFLKRYDPTTQLLTLRFGSGNASTLDDDIVPDPSELSLNLFGKPVVTKFSIDPQSLLNTQTLGISPRGTQLTIRYRYGGGLDHNVPSNSIETIENLSISFRNNPSASDANLARQTIVVTNEDPARGGNPAPTLQELQTRIISARKSQKRVVTREDLLARIYTLPSEFGRVYRAAVTDNPINPGSALLYVVSRNADGSLGVSPDTLKKNISIYLNELRLIGDAVDILDAKIINFKINYSVIVSDNANKSQVITNINVALSEAMGIKYFNINQPIIADDIINIIINSDFVISLSELSITPLTGIVEDRTYSSATFAFEQTQITGAILPDQGSIFELKYPDFDIVGTAF
jgi:hypothetical protein